MYCKQKEELTYFELVRKTVSKSKVISAEDEGDLLTFQRHDGVHVELWVGPIGLEPHLRMMHISKIQAEEAFGLDLKEMISRCRAA